MHYNFNGLWIRAYGAEASIFQVENLGSFQEMDVRRDFSVPLARHVYVFLR